MEMYLTLYIVHEQLSACWDIPQSSNFHFGVSADVFHVLSLEWIIKLLIVFPYSIGFAAVSRLLGVPVILFLGCLATRFFSSITLIVDQTKTVKTHDGYPFKTEDNEDPSPHK